MAIKIIVEGPVGSGKSLFLRDLQHLMSNRWRFISEKDAPFERQLENIDAARDIVIYSEKTTSKES